jgi:hypothetical protein
MARTKPSYTLRFPSLVISLREKREGQHRVAPACRGPCNRTWASPETPPAPSTPLLTPGAPAVGCGPRVRVRSLQASSSWKSSGVSFAKSPRERKCTGLVSAEGLGASPCSASPPSLFPPAPPVRVRRVQCAASVFAVCSRASSETGYLFWGPKFSLWSPKFGAMCAELAACSDQTKAQQRRERPGCIAY